MVLVDSCPRLSIPLHRHETISKIIHISHTTLLVLLTKSTVYIYNQHALLPLCCHQRTIESIEQHGYNCNIKARHISVDTSQLQKLHKVNLFVETDFNYLVIYQVHINYSNSLYEVYSSKNDQLLQSGYPLSVSKQRFSLSNLIKSATKSLQGKQSDPLNLENIESFSNASNEDAMGNLRIDDAKINVFKILKVAVGIKKYWLKQNSHNLLIFNERDEKIDGQENVFQIINMQTFRNQLFYLSEFSWYNCSNNSQIKYINFNIFKNYFLFVNNVGEVWYMEFEQDRQETEGSDLAINGFKIFEVPNTCSCYKISFNPRFNLILFQTDDILKLYSIEYLTDLPTLKYIKTIHHPLLVKNELTWSSCGNFFVGLNVNTGCWCLSSKLGNITFSSFEFLKEINNHNDFKDSIDFLKSSLILISPNSCCLYLINKRQSKLYLLDLLSICDLSSDQYSYNTEYLNILQNGIQMKFPILPQFKSLISRIERFNGNLSSKIASGSLKITSNEYHQLSISYGDFVAVSTPYKSSVSEFNHILWFNLKHYFINSFNFINHFWYDDYLILINRLIENGSCLDEIIVLNTKPTKFGSGGIDFKFDNDTIIWRHNFGKCFINIEIIQDSVDLSHLVLFTDDYKLIIIDFCKNDATRRTSSAGLQESKNFNIFIGLNKSIYLSTIKNKLSLSSIIKMSMIDKRHFLFLLDTGELYLLKNQIMNDTDDQKNNDHNIKKPSNIYELILIRKSVEFFQFQIVKFNKKNIIQYIYLFDGNSILIFDLQELVDVASAEFSEEHSLEPISIQIDNYRPITIDDTVAENLKGMKSIDLIGLETSLSSFSSNLSIRNKVNHKIILNNFIEHDLIRKIDLNIIYNKFKSFEIFNYSLELLLFEYLTESKVGLLKELIQIIEKTTDSASIYINCLRKIEVIHWNTFFDTLKTTPVKFMNRLIELDNVELCYNYLIIYLNFKREGDDEIENINSLNEKDKEVILKIIKMLDKAQKWDWCFELCRFIKLLDPTSKFLNTIKSQLE